MGGSVFVDGSGGPRGGYGYLVRETGESYYESSPGVTNNQAEYMAVIAALRRFAGPDGVVIYSDSQTVVRQLNHEYAINNARLRALAREAWRLAGGPGRVEIRWVPRGENIAGRMMGS